MRTTSTILVATLLCVGALAGVVPSNPNETGFPAEKMGAISEQREAEMGMADAGGDMAGMGDMAAMDEGEPTPVEPEGGLDPAEESEADPVPEYVVARDEMGMMDNQAVGMNEACLIGVSGAGFTDYDSLLTGIAYIIDPDTGAGTLIEGSDFSVRGAECNSDVCLLAPITAGPSGQSFVLLDIDDMDGTPISVLAMPWDLSTNPNDFSVAPPSCCANSIEYANGLFWSSIYVSDLDGTGAGTDFGYAMLSLDPSNPTTFNSIVEISPSGLYFNGLAYDSDSGVMYGIQGGNSVDPAGLYTIDLTTGVATGVGKTGIVAGGLAYFDGTLFAGGAGLFSGFLYSLDKTTGIATTVGPTGYSMRISSMLKLSDCSIVERLPNVAVETAMGMGMGEDLEAQSIVAFIPEILFEYIEQVEEIAMTIDPVTGRGEPISTETSNTFAVSCSPYGICGSYTFNEGISFFDLRDPETVLGSGGPITGDFTMTAMEWAYDRFWCSIFVTAAGGIPGPAFGSIDPANLALFATLHSTPVLFNSLAFDGDTSTMYAIQATFGAPAMLYTIDVITADITPIGNTGIAAGGMVFYDGVLYAGGSWFQSGAMFTLDTATGTATVLGKTGFGRRISAMTLAPTSLLPALEEIRSGAVDMGMGMGETVDKVLLAFAEANPGAPVPLLDSFGLIVDENTGAGTLIALEVSFKGLACNPDGLCCASETESNGLIFFTLDDPETLLGLGYPLTGPFTVNSIEWADGKFVCGIQHIFGYALAFVDDKILVNLAEVRFGLPFLVEAMAWDAENSEMYGVDGMGFLYTINLGNTVITPVGSTGLSLGGMAFLDGTLYAGGFDISTNRIWTLDTATAAPTVVGPTGYFAPISAMTTVPTGSVSGLFSKKKEAESKQMGMADDMAAMGSTKELVGSINQVNLPIFPTLDDVLITINPANGEGTIAASGLGARGLACNDENICAICSDYGSFEAFGFIDMAAGALVAPPFFDVFASCLGMEWAEGRFWSSIVTGGISLLINFDSNILTTVSQLLFVDRPLNALAYNTNTDTMYAVGFDILNSPLVTVDLVTGATTVVGSGSGKSLSGLTFYNDILYASGTFFQSGDIFTMDIATGLAAFLGSTGFDRRVSALTSFDVDVLPYLAELPVDEPEGMAADDLEYVLVAFATEDTKQSVTERVALVIDPATGAGTPLVTNVDFAAFGCSAGGLCAGYDVQLNGIAFNDMTNPSRVLGRGFPIFGFEYPLIVGGFTYGDNVIFGSISTPYPFGNGIAVFDPRDLTDIAAVLRGTETFLTGLAYDDATSTLYGVDGQPSATLYTVNQYTGSLTAVGSTGVSLGGMTFFNGVLYASGTGSNAGDIFTLDPSTASATFVGASGATADLTALAVLPASVLDAFIPDDEDTDASEAMGMGMNDFPFEFQGTITCATGSVSGDTTGAPSNIDPYNNNAGEHYYKLVVNENSAAMIQTCAPGTSFDTTLAVYAEDKLDLDELLVFNDDSWLSAGVCSSVSLLLLESTDYYVVVVSGWGGEEGAYELTIDCESIAVPEA